MELSLLIALTTGVITVLGAVWNVARGINQKLILLYEISRCVKELKTQDRAIQKQVTHHEIFMIRNFPEYIPFSNEPFIES
ncbi:hypothetical protein SPB21_27685 [Leptothoe sp. ISB3NOV94-8A]